MPIDKAILERSLADAHRRKNTLSVNTYDYDRGGKIFQMMPQNVARDLTLYGSLTKIMQPSGNVKRVANTVMANMLLGLPEGFFHSDSKVNFVNTRRKGRDHTKKQIENYLEGMTALEVVYDKSTIGRYKQTTRYESMGLDELMQTPEWNGEGDYEVVYVQNPGLKTAETKRQEAIDRLAEGYAERFEEHMSFLQDELELEDFSEIFDPENSYGETYVNCLSCLEHEDLDDDLRQSFEALSKVFAYAAIANGNPNIESVFADEIEAEIEEGLTEEEYINKLSQNVIGNGGILILEGMKTREIDGFVFVTEHKGVCMYQQPDFHEHLYPKAE